VDRSVLADCDGAAAWIEGRNFMPAHLRHASVLAELLPRWLELFRQTTDEHRTPEPARALVDIAERMAQALEVGLARKGQQSRKS
jgi:truncated hemoglobin YjbI